MKPWLAILIVLLVGCGSVSRYSASTEATYQISPDGKKITYSSEKEYGGLNLELVEKEGQVTVLKIHVDSAKTSEAAIAAALQTQLKLAEILQTLLPLVEKAAMAGS